MVCDIARCPANLYMSNTLLFTALSMMGYWLALPPTAASQDCSQLEPASTGYRRKVNETGWECALAGPGHVNQRKIMLLGSSHVCCCDSYGILTLCSNIHFCNSEVKLDSCGVEQHVPETNNSAPAPLPKWSVGQAGLPSGGKQVKRCQV